MKNMEPRYIDVHSHVTFKEYDTDLPEVLKRMEDERVWTMTVGVDHATSQEAVAFADTHDGFWATIGLHPTDTADESFNSSIYGTMVAHQKVVAIGECGLDYFRIQGDIPSEKKRQKEEFEKQLEFAIEHDKPLMLHSRPSKGTLDAYEDLLSILEARKKEAGDRLRGDVHFFVGNVPIARRFYDMGFTTSFTGVLTFAHEYDEVVRFAPLDMILTETDSPFAAPEPFRGRRNEPTYVKYVVEAIARIRKTELEPVREAVVSNAKRVFAL